MSIDPNNLQATATLRFSKEFDRFLSWDGSRGLNTTGGPQWNGRVTAVGTLPYNNELQWYVNANAAAPVSVRDDNPFSISDGALTITARRTAAADRELFHGQAYTSGLVSTDRTFSQTYGYFEMRAQLPAGRGLWPAFWLLPIDGSWPPEIDVMEMLGDRPGVLHTTVHSQASGQERLGGTHFQTTASATVADLSAGFHTFGVDWEPDAITWYLDGQRVFSAPTPADLDRPMYMIANLAVGGDWPGSPDAATSFPAAMRIDYIRAYAARTPDTISASHPIQGSDAADQLQGDSGSDTIYGSGGNDIIRGNAGQDVVHGGTGGDLIYGGSGPGDPLDAADVLFGDEGSDVIYGNAGDDVIYGGRGISDPVDAGDVIFGGLGNDTIFGNGGDDVLYGNEGNDTLFGGAGNDVFEGGAGTDRYVFEANSGVDLIRGFNQAKGDRISLQGQTYTLVTRSEGAAQLNLSGGGQIILAGVVAAAVNASYFA